MGEGSTGLPDLPAWSGIVDVLHGDPEVELHQVPDEGRQRETSLLDLAYDAVVEWDFETTRITVWNPSAEQLYGWSAEEAIGRSPHALLRTIFPRSLGAVRESLVRVGRWEGELVHTTRTGRQVIVSSRWAIYREGDRPPQVLEINTDITERKAAEAERAQLAAIVNSSSDAIIGKTLDGTVTSWNPAAERLYGYAALDIIGKSIEMIVPPDLHDEYADMMRRLRRGETIANWETRRVHRDGTEIDVSISVSPIRGRTGIVIGAATIARDITRRKREEAERVLLLEREREAREQAESAQRRLSFLAEASSVLTSSLDYETTLANVARMAVPHMADWCSINIVDERGEVRRLAVMHADPAKIELAVELERRYPPNPSSDGGTAGVIRTGRAQLIPHITDEMVSAGAQDAEHEELVRSLGLSSLMIVPLTARGSVLGAITFATAESGNQYGPDDLALAEDLARRAGTAVDNARLYHDVQQALRLREDFLSIASHELRTPLTALQLQTQLLRRYIERSEIAVAPDVGNRVIEAVERQVKRLSRLTNDLLDVSRIAAGKFTLERAEVDLGRLVRDVAERFSADLAAARCRLTLDIEPNVVGRLDRHRLDQVISNLLSNAIKYGRGNPITISVRRHAEAAVIEVADRGVGIAKDDLLRIFDRFERVGTSERAGGLGLGLFIVQQILQAHGGRIRVESELGSGSRFTVELPL